MKVKVVGIVGVAGRYGQWLKACLEGLGYRVIGSDLDTEQSNRQVIEASDVVIFSIPPRVANKVIREAVPFSKRGQLWLDITSLKREPIEAMLESRADVIGLHPMCAPTNDSWKGQTVIVCRARANEAWYNWLLQFLLEMKATIKIATPQQHDKAVAFVQVLPHFSQLVTAAVLSKMDADISDTLEYTSPFYRIAFSLMGRILAQNPNLYYEIQVMNPYTIEVLEVLEDEVRRLSEIIRSRDRDRFLEQFSTSKNHFGEGPVQNAFGLFELLNKTLADWTTEYSVIIRSTEDRRGVLANCLGILADAGINLTSIRSDPEAIPGHCRFIIGIDRRADDDNVLAALRQMSQKIPTLTTV